MLFYPFHQLMSTLKDAEFLTIINKTKRRAVERELEIIGEAVSKLLKINPGISISYARQIVDLRNKVIHSYDNVNDIAIWSIIMNHLPTLKIEVELLMKNV
jgi:uncharacterized protein with HEPN domain